MKKNIVLAAIISISMIGYVAANPLPECEVSRISIFPPEIEIYFHIGMDISGTLINTLSGTAVVDSGVVGEDDEFVILDSSNTSGFTLYQEADTVQVVFPFWDTYAIKYGTLGSTPNPIRGHAICKTYYSPQHDWEHYETWSFCLAEPDWGWTDIVISEINVHGTWQNGSSFIEFYNIADSTIRLDGWRIVCDTIYDLPTEAVILPQGFYVIDYDDFPDAFDMDFSADNIYLIKPPDQYFNLLVDQVGWSSDHGENVSFMRYPDGQVDPSDWNWGYRGYNDQSSYTFENGFPSRGAPNRHESPGFVVIGANAAGSEGTVDLYWTNPIWDEMYNSSVAVRGDDHFPETIDDGSIVYQGTNQHVTDTNLGSYWYYYTIFARNDGGEYSIPTAESRVSIYLGGSVGIDDEILPERISYLRAYPNPFNPTTTIDFGLIESSDITLSIYNLLGQQIATIYEGVKEAGDHSIVWDASAFPSGVYFARLEAGGRSENVKMVLLK